MQVSYAGVLGYWREDESFRSFFIGLLSAAPFAAYRWETPPVTAATAGRPFEFVLLDAPGLDQAADASAFATHFRTASGKQSVVAFPNLGRDAVLVVPCPAAGTPPAAYAHFAAFTRGAPIAQQHDLWRTVAASMTARLGTSPVWLSTAGLGVPWLHIRLDDRPKYYAFAEYRGESVSPVR